MDFKGTKKDWKLDYPVIYADNYFQTHICEIPDTYTNEEAKANALLISKAPEMLEMLMILLGDIRKGPVDFTKSEKIKMARRLIKEATGLCENT